MSTFRSSRAAAVVAVASLLAGTAAATECPAEHRLTEARSLAAPPDNVASREILQWIDVSTVEGVSGSLALRMRRLTIPPAGFVPLHYHHDRPAVDSLVQGELTEHNSFCAVPIVHQQGDTGMTYGDFVGHWWENTGDVDAVILSIDIVPLDQVNF